MAKVIPISLGFVKVFLIQGKKSILIDAGISGKAETIVTEIEKLGINPKEISLIVVSHSHLDHIGSLAKLKEITGAKVAVHKSEVECLKTGAGAEAKPYSFLAKVLTKFTPEMENAEPVEADLVIEDQFSLEEFGVAGKIIHIPGHTAGSVAVILDNGQAVIGDSIGGPGKMNFNRVTYPTFLTDLSELKRSLQKLLQLSVQEFYNSHGEMVKADEVRKLIAKQS